MKFAAPAPYNNSFEGSNLYTPRSSQVLSRAVFGGEIRGSRHTLFGSPSRYMLNPLPPRTFVEYIYSVAKSRHSPPMFYGSSSRFTQSALRAHVRWWARFFSLDGKTCPQQVRLPRLSGEPLPQLKANASSADRASAGYGTLLDRKRFDGGLGGEPAAADLPAVGGREGLAAAGKDLAGPAKHVKTDAKCKVRVKEE